MAIRNATALVAVCATALLLGVSSVRAELVLSGTDIDSSLETFGGQGFGNFPRLLTLQQTGSPNDNPTGAEAGQVAIVNGTFQTTTFDGRNDTTSACCDGNKNSAPSLGQLGWTSASDVKIAFNSDQTGTSGITLVDLVLTVYNGTTPIFTASLDDDLSPLAFSADQVKEIPGNGNAAYTFVLDQAERDILDALLGSGSDAFRIALGSSLLGTNDGPDSFRAILGEGGVPVPLPGALILFASGLAGLVALNRRRTRRPGMMEMAS